MKNKMRRLSAFLMALLMSVTLFSGTASAAAGTTVALPAAVTNLTDLCKPAPLLLKKVTVKATSITELKASSKKTITVKWEKVSSVAGYEVQYATASDFAKAEKVKTTKTSCTISKLKAGSKYYVRVRAYKKSDGKTVYSAWSKKKSVTVPKAKTTSSSSGSSSGSSSSSSSGSSSGSSSSSSSGSSSSSSSSSSQSDTVYITDTGDKYHTGSCRYLKKSKIQTTKKKAKSAGYTPCSVCKPGK